MTINQIIRELISIPKTERMKNLPWHNDIRCKTKNGHEVRIWLSEEFIAPIHEIDAHLSRKQIEGP